MNNCVSVPIKFGMTVYYYFPNSWMFCH